MALSHPSVFLVHALPLITPPALKALDAACGAGRNSHWLASQGYEIDAVDVSCEALNRGREIAESHDVKTIHWHQLDLDHGLPPQLTGYGLIVMVRYLDLSLLNSSVSRLLSGGYLLAEVHLQSDQEVAGPSGTDFRAAPDELRMAVHGLDIIEYFEGLEVDPDGRQVALARVLAKKP